MFDRFGGSGTTANTFVYILWACLQRPDVVEKLKAELRESFPNPRIVPDYRVRCSRPRPVHVANACQTCASLPYLQAVINETLRRYPTIIATLPRTARETTTVTGIDVPKGVSTPSWILKAPC